MNLKQKICNFKKVLSIVLVVLMIFSTFGGTINVFAVENADSEFDMEFVGSDEAIKLAVDSDGICSHEAIVSRPEIEGNCTFDGYTAGEYCLNCKTWLSGREKVVVSHKDDNEDGVCDICLNVIDLDERALYAGEYIRFYSSNEGYNYFAFYPQKTDSYEFDVYGEDSISVEVLDADKNIIENSEVLYAGEKYYIAIWCKENFSYRIEIDGGCLHEDTYTVEREEPTCTQPGRTEGVYCYDCGNYASGYEYIDSKHTDNDNDDICDLCNAEINPSISVGETKSVLLVDEEEYKISFIPENSGEYCFTAKDYSTVVTLCCGDVQLDYFYSSWWSEEVPVIVYNFEKGKEYQFIIQHADSYSGSSGYDVPNYTFDVCLSDVICLHEDLEELEDIEPLCTNYGYYGIKKCSSCKMIVYNGSQEDPIGHSNYEWTISKNSDCNKTGVAESVCTNCGEKCTKIIPVSHTDKDLDGNCDLCSKPASDIRTNEIQYITVDGNSYFTYIPIKTGIKKLSGVAPKGSWMNPNSDLTIFDSKMNALVDTEANELWNYRAAYNFIAGEVYYFNIQSVGLWGVPNDETIEVGLLLSDCEHKNTSEINYNDNCVKTVKKGVFCSDCKLTLVSSETEGEHDYTYEYVEETCYSEGYEIEYCTVCNDVINRYSYGYLPHEDSNNDNICDVCSFNIKKPESESEYIAIGETKNVSLNPGEKMSFKFIPLSEGYYTVTVNPCDKIDFYLEEQNNVITIGESNQVNSKGSALIEYYYDNDERTISFELKDDQEPIEVTVKLEETIIETSYSYEYMIADGEAIITDFDETYYGNVIIPDYIEGYPVTTIGRTAFSNCLGVKSVVLPETVTYINRAAFQGCKNLEEIKIPSGVSFISNSTFYDCIRLKNIVLPENIEGIEARAFVNCRSLTNIEFPNGMWGIDYEAFSGCTKLENIIIPETVERIGENAFEGTPWYEKLADGCIYIGKVLYEYRGDMPKNYKLEIKSGTTSIGVSAFAGNNNLVSIVFPESMKYIEAQAFTMCNSITTIDVPKNVEFIGRGAFAECGSLVYADVDSKIESLNNELFMNCFNLEQVVVPENIKAVYAQVFEGCINLKNFEIPKSVEIIGEQAFADCKLLVNLVIPETTKEIWPSAFIGCYALDSITILNRDAYIAEFAFGCDRGEDFSVNERYIYYYVSLNDKTIVGYNSSTAQQYAEDNNINFEAIDDYECKHTEDGYETVTTKENIIDATYDKAGSYEEVITCRNCDAELGRETKDIPALWLSNISFEFDEETLIISGIGEIPKLDNPSDYPWSQYSMMTTAVYLVGVNSVSSNAFENFNSIRFMMIDSQSITIKKDAFANSDFLYTVVTFGNTVVEDGAFVATKLYSEAGKSVVGYESVEFYYGDNIVHFNGDVNISKDDLYALIGASHYRYGQDNMINALKFNQFSSNQFGSDNILLFESWESNEPIGYPLTDATVYVCVGTSEANLERKSFNDFAMGGYMGDSDAVIRFCVETPVNEEDPEESLTFIEKVINKIRSFFTTIKFWLKKLFGIVS